MKIVFDLFIKGIFLITGIFIRWLISKREMRFKDFKNKYSNYLRDLSIGIGTWMVFSTHFYYLYTLVTGNKYF